MMSESEYQDLAKVAFKKLDATLGDLDPDAVDCDWAADVMTLAFAGGKKCVVNTQRPTRQIWVAANARAWHFTWDGARWVDEKERRRALHHDGAHRPRARRGRGPLRLSLWRTRVARRACAPSSVRSTSCSMTRWSASCSRGRTRRGSSSTSCGSPRGSSGGRISTTGGRCQRRTRSCRCSRVTSIGATTCCARCSPPPPSRSTSPPSGYASIRASAQRC